MVLQEEITLPANLKQAVDFHSRSVKCPFEVPQIHRALEKQGLSLETEAEQSRKTALLMTLEKSAFPCLGGDVLFHLSTETRAPRVLHTEETWGFASGGPREELGMATKHHLLTRQLKKEY